MGYLFNLDGTNIGREINQRMLPGLLKIILASLLICFGCSSNNADLAGAALPIDTVSPTAPQPTFTEQVVETATSTASPVPALAPDITVTVVPTETEIPGSATLRSRGEKKNIQVGVYLD